MTASVGRIVLCPRCGTQVEWGPQNRYRPFCSARCRDVDLGHWFGERYTVPATEPGDEEDAT